MELARRADWSRLFVLAEAHGVLGHLAVGVRGLDESLVPEEIRQMLLEHHREQILPAAAYDRGDGSPFASIRG